VETFTTINTLTATEKDTAWNETLTESSRNQRSILITNREFYMPKYPRKEKTRRLKHTDQANVAVVDVDYIEHKAVAPFAPITKIQREYKSSLLRNLVTFCTGPSGTGKTYVAISIAAEKLQNKEIDKIIITRPAVPAGGENFGALPGTLEEKFAPWMQPIIDILVERLGKSNFENKVKNGRIIFAPLAYIRGSTFKDCWVMMTEAQNATCEQMKLFLTRFGGNCTMIVEGDIGQRDIRQFSGLAEALRVTRDMGTVGIIKFTTEDCVRHTFVKELLQAYEKLEAERDREKADAKILSQLNNISVPPAFGGMVDTSLIFAES